MVMRHSMPRARRFAVTGAVLALIGVALLFWRTHQSHPERMRAGKFPEQLVYARILKPGAWLKCHPSVVPVATRYRPIEQSLLYCARFDSIKMRNSSVGSKRSVSAPFSPLLCMC